MISLIRQYWNGKAPELGVPLLTNPHQPTHSLSHNHPYQPFRALDRRVFNVPF